MTSETEISRAFILGDSIQYASGSVVSKSILKNPAGNISIFAFDEGEGLAEHNTPHSAMVQVLDGAAEITVGGHLNVLEAGQCIILPANVPHSVKANKKFKMMLTMIKG